MVEQITGQKTVLLVDDEITLLKLYGMILGAEGYSVLTATNPAEALQVIAKQQQATHPLDLIITDLRMPNPGDGIRMIQELASTLSILPPTLVMSGTPEDAFKEIAELQKQGVRIDILQKPVPHKVFIDAIANLLR